MSRHSSSASGGLGLCTTLVVIFVVLKATDNIAWSWWWVFSPWWIPFGVVAAIGLVYLLCKLLVLPFALFSSRSKFNRDVDSVMSSRRPSDWPPDIR